MEIKAADVMKLRKMTGAGMMDCKKALIEAEGDFARAQDIIREKGKLVVAKRADRTATEGVVVTKIVGQKAYLLCLACETDFVAQNAEYTASANAMLEVAVKNDAADRDALMASKNDEGHTVEEMVTEKSGQTGEKIELAYYARIEAPYCAAYVHFNKKLGTILGFNKEVPAEVAHTVAMQATAGSYTAVEFWFDPTSPTMDITPDGSTAPFSGASLAWAVTAIVVAVAGLGSALAGRAKGDWKVWGAVGAACVLVSALALRVVFYMTGISIYPFF